MLDNNRTTPAADPFAEPALYDLKTFCRQHGGINVSTLYRMWTEGRGPRRTKLGRRTFVTREAAAEWRRRMEAETSRSERDPGARP